MSSTEFTVLIPQDEVEDVTKDTDLLLKTWVQEPYLNTITTLRSNGDRRVRHNVRSRPLVSKRNMSVGYAPRQRRAQDLNVSLTGTHSRRGQSAASTRNTTPQLEEGDTSKVPSMLGSLTPLEQQIRVRTTYKERSDEEDEEFIEEDAEDDAEDTDPEAETKKLFEKLNEEALAPRVQQVPTTRNHSGVLITTLHPPKRPQIVYRKRCLFPYI